MSETVDEILQELRGISFSADNPPPDVSEEETPSDGSTPSVTETLQIVRELLGEKQPPEPEPPEPQWESPLDFPGQSQQFPQPESSEDFSGEQSFLEKEPDSQPEGWEEPDEQPDFPDLSVDTPVEPTVEEEIEDAEELMDAQLDDPIEDQAPEAAPTLSYTPQSEEETPSAAGDTRVIEPVEQPEQQGHRRFTPVVRMHRKDARRSRREQAVSGTHTRRFASTNTSYREGKLEGGAGLRKITRPASQGEADSDQPTLRLSTPGAPQESSPPPVSPEEQQEQLQAVLDQVEELEKEPSPELNRSELRKLRRAQRAAGEERNREKQRQEAARAEQKEKNLYKLKEEVSNETAEGFAPCFEKLKGLNSSSRVGSWKRQLREMAGSSMGLFLLLFFLAMAILVLESLPGMMAESMGRAVLLWTSVVLGLVAGVAGSGVLLSGLKTFFLLRENRDNLPFMVYLVTMVQTVILALNPEEAARPEVHAFLPVGVLSLATAYLARWVTASAATKNLRFLNTGGTKYYLHVIRDSRLATEMTRGVVEGPAFVAVNRKTEAVSDFMRMSFAKDDSDRMARNLSAAGFAAALLSLGFGTLFTADVFVGCTIMTAVACLCAPVVTPFLFSYPSRRVAKFMEKSGGVVIGERAVSRYSLLNGALLDARDLFPSGFVTLSGMKTYGSARVDDVILDAASIAMGSGSVLEGIFEGVIGRDERMLRPVEERQYEDGRGLIGFVNGQQVLFGNRALLESRGIPFPVDEHRAWTAGVGCAVVYLASGGELSGAFLIRLQPSASEEAVQVFADNGITLTIQTVDSFMTPRLLGRLFRVNPDMIKILPQRLQVYAERLRGEVRIKQAVAVNDGSPEGFSGCAACSKRLVLMEGLGRALIILSVILGLAMFLMLTLLGSLYSVTAAAMTIYAVSWLLLEWILQKLIRI